MTDFAIKVQGLGNEYIIGGAEQRHESLREMLTGALKSPFRKIRKLGGKVSEEERFWALKDISFDVKQGEVLGIIGRNGAGKSTLLKVLSRITSPTEGRAVTRGRVASLLEVGTGFHPELTGRENIYLNGAILGMSRMEIDTCFEQIVDSAEIDKFLDTPLKRYSSGMYVRLAFAVAAHVDVDILVVDEVLAVGDQEFQRKCIGKMGEVSSSGKTVLFVSHNMGAITSLCTRAIFLSEGLVEFDGAVSEAVSSYLANAPAHNGDFSSRYFIGKLKNKVEFRSVLLNGTPIKDSMPVVPQEELVFDVAGTIHMDLKNFELQLSVFRDGLQLVTVHDTLPDTDLIEGEFISSFMLPANFLRPGRYSFGLGGFRRGSDQWFWGADLGTFTVIEKWADNYRENSLGLINCELIGSRWQE